MKVPASQQQEMDTIRLPDLTTERLIMKHRSRVRVLQGVTQLFAFIIKLIYFLGSLTNVIKYQFHPVRNWSFEITIAY